MRDDPPNDVSAILETFHDAGRDRLFETAYPELRRIAACLMAREAPGQTLQPTALVNEAYLRLVGGPTVDWNDRRHFLNTVARSMRQVLVDRARRVGAVRHGAGRTRVDIADIDMGTADEVPVHRVGDLESALAQLEHANARWSEVVLLRFYVGLTVEQTAEVMDVSPTLVKKDWKFARTWLVAAMQRDGDGA